MFNCEKCKSELNLEDNFFMKDDSQIRCEHFALKSFRGFYKCNNCNFQSIEENKLWDLENSKCHWCKNNIDPYKRCKKCNEITCYEPNSFHDIERCICSKKHKCTIKDTDSETETDNNSESEESQKQIEEDNSWWGIFKNIWS